MSTLNDELMHKGVFSISKDYENSKRIRKQIELDLYTEKASLRKDRLRCLAEVKRKEQRQDRILQRKINNRISAQRSRDNVKKALRILQEKNKILSEENWSLKENIGRLAKGACLKRRDENSIDVSTDNSNDLNFDSTALGGGFTCRFCGKDNDSEFRHSQGVIEMKPFVNESDSQMNLQGELFTQRSTTGLFGSSLMKYGMFLGVLGFICFIATIGLSSNGRGIDKAYKTTRRVLQYIQGESLPRLDFRPSDDKNSTNVTFQGTPNLPLYIDKKFKELSNLKEIDIIREITKKQRSITLADPKEEYRGILNKKRRHFINRIVSSMKDNSDYGCMKDASDGMIENSTIMPLMIRESAIRDQIGGKVGSVVLTEGITEGNGLKEILGNTDSNECMYLHMIIPADVFRTSDNYFESNPKSLWEVGCKIFRLNKINSD